MLIGLGAALAAAVLFGVAAVVQAVAARDHATVSRQTATVLALYLAGWLLHLVAIARLPLYLAQAGIALSLVVTAIVAARVVHEPLALRHWVAVAATVVGLGLVVVASGGVGRNLFTTNRTLTLYTAALATLVLGLVVRRRRDRRAGVVLGVLAGIAYAGSPVATRSLVDPRLDVETIAPAVTIGVFGLLGFWLYSMAMRRTSVTAATAPLVLLETLVPAVVGVLVFGDGVRNGLWPLVVVGLATSVTGAVVLCGAENRLEHLEHLPHLPTGTTHTG